MGPTLFTWKILNGPSGFTLEITGAITETFDPTEVFQSVQTQVPKGVPQLWIDLGKMTRMNSAGCRRWIRFIGLVQAAYPSKFLEVPEVLMDLVLIAPQVLGDPQLSIRTIHVPFICKECTTRFIARIQLANLDPSQIKSVGPDC